jgi:hypothetical protein
MISMVLSLLTFSGFLLLSEELRKGNPGLLRGLPNLFSFSFTG